MGVKLIQDLSCFEINRIALVIWCRYTVLCLYLIRRNHNTMNRIAGPIKYFRQSVRLLTTNAERNENLLYF